MRPPRLKNRQILLLIGAVVIDVASRVVLAHLTVDLAPQLVALFVRLVMYGF